MALIKKIPFFILAFFSGLLTGVDITVSAGMLSLSAFLRSFFPRIYQEQTGHDLPDKFCQYSNSTLIKIAFLPYGLGMTVGFFTIWLQSRLGVRKLIIASTILVAAGGIISVVSPIGFIWYLSGRIILGIGLAVFRQVVPKYLYEVPPRECRDCLDIIYDLSSTLGTMLGSVFIFSEFGNSNITVWRWMCAPAILLAFILIFISIFLLPESPIYLMICRKNEMAMQSLQRILDIDRVQEEFDRVEEEADRLREVSPFLELFKKSSLPHLFIHVPSFIFRSFMGASTLLLFLPVFLTSTGLGKTASLSASLCTGITSFVIGLLASVLIHHFQFGRRSIILVGCVIVILMQFILGSVLHHYVKPGLDLDDFISVLVVILMCVFVAGTALVVNPMGWLSQSYPRTSHSVGSVFSRNANPTIDFVLSMMFLHILCSIEARIFFIFGAVSALALLYVFFFLPNGLPGVGMDQQWGDHYIWGQFVNNDHVGDAPVVVEDAPVVVEDDHAADAPVVVEDDPDV